jgi:hypothetical protein
LNLKWELEWYCLDADARSLSDPLEAYAGSFGATARSENRSRVPNTL